MIKKLLTVGFITALCGCSNSPSDSEAKDAIVKALGECNRVSVGNVKKTNGAAVGDNRYKIAVDYELKVIGSADGEQVQTKLAARTADINEKLAGAQRALASAQDALKEAKNKLESYAQETAAMQTASDKESVQASKDAIANSCKNGSECANKSSMISQQAYKTGSARAVDYAALVVERNKAMKNVDEAEATVKTVESDRFKSAYSPKADFDKACPNIDRSIYAAISQASNQYDSANKGKNAFLAGFVANISSEITLVKTDNGWKTGL